MKIKMEKFGSQLLVFQLLMLSLLYLSCNNNSAESNQQSESLDNLERPNNSHILIFLDKSSSLKKKDSILSVFKQNLKEFVKNNYSKNGDRIKGFYIHGNTLGGTPFLESEFQVAKPNLVNQGQLDQNKLKTEYKLAINRKKKEALDKIPESFVFENKTSTSKETDIWSTFEVMSRFYSKADPDDNCYAFYIRDMVESMTDKGRRNFHRIKIKSKEEAEKMALEDAKWILKNRDVNPANLAKVKVWIWIPRDPGGQNDFGMLRYYWRKLFAEMGITEVSEDAVSG